MVYISSDMFHVFDEPETLVTNLVEEVRNLISFLTLPPL